MNSYIFKQGFRVGKKTKKNKIIIYDIYVSSNIHGKQQQFINFLPILHSSIFYDDKIWRNVEEPLLVKTKEKNTESIKLLFAYTKITKRDIFSSFSYPNSHINYSFWKIDACDYSKENVKEFLQKNIGNFANEKE